MRPQPIPLFERLYLASLLLAAISVAVGWEGLRQVAQPGLLLALAAALFALLIGLVLLTARRRSVAAKWILVLITLVGVGVSLPAVPQAIARGGSGWMGLLQTLLQLIAVSLLFTAPARAWFRSPRDAA